MMMSCLALMLELVQEPKVPLPKKKSCQEV